WIPVPASSLQAYVVASALLTLPAVLANFHVATSFARAAQEFLRRDAGLVPALLALLAAVVIVFARLMHRPAETADLARRLGAAGATELAVETRAAVRRALVPTTLFFLAIVLAGARA